MEAEGRVSEGVDPFEKLAADVQAARAAERNHQAQLNADRNKVSQQWQGDISRLVIEAGNKLMAVGVRFGQVSLKIQEDTLLGLSYPIYGDFLRSHLEFAVSHPAKLDVFLRGKTSVSVDIADVFPRDQLSSAVADVLRKALL